MGLHCNRIGCTSITYQDRKNLRKILGLGIALQCTNTMCESVLFQDLVKLSTAERLGRVKQNFRIAFNSRRCIRRWNVSATVWHGVGGPSPWLETRLGFRETIHLLGGAIRANSVRETFLIACRAGLCTHWKSLIDHWNHYISSGTLELYPMLLFFKDHTAFKPWQQIYSCVRSVSNFFERKQNWRAVPYRNWPSVALKRTPDIILL